MKSFKHMHGKMDKCVYKLGPATARAAGASPTSKKTHPWISEQRKRIKVTRNDDKYIKMIKIHENASTYMSFTWKWIIDPIKCCEQHANRSQIH